jgi:outer membrane protein assembly factor BamB
MDFTTFQGNRRPEIADLDQNFRMARGAVERRSLSELGYMTKLWSYQLPGKEPIYSSPVGPVTLRTGATPHACVLFQAWDWYVYALKISDGTLLWRRATGDSCYGRCQAGDTNADGFNEVFASSHDGKIYSMNDTGTANNWTFNNLYDREASGTATAGTNGTTLFDSTKAWAANAFLRPNAADGARIAFTSGAAVGQAAKPITVSAGGTSVGWAVAFAPAPAAGDTYVITPYDPSDKYFQHAGTLVNESGTRYLYVSGSDNHAYKLNANTGAIVWKYATKEQIEPYPLVVTVSGTRYCYIVSIDGYTRCLNASTGAQVWATATGQCDAFLSAADLDSDGVVEIIVASRDNRVYSLDGLTGALKKQTTDTGSWDYGDIDSSAVPVLVPGEIAPRVVTGGDGGTVWCFDRNLYTKWSQLVCPNVVNSSPVFHDVEGTNELCVLMGDMRGTLHCIDMKTGRLVGQEYVKGGIEGMPLVGDIDGDGKVEIVMTTTDGWVECYRFTNGSAYSASYFPGNSVFLGKQG